MFIDGRQIDRQAAYLPCDYRCKLAAEPWELAGYWKLRREVFCLEQGLFENDDADPHDEQARPIVAVSEMMGMPDRVVGAVRIYPAGPGTWFGSRLAVDADFRGVNGLGATLIRKAVGTAIALGCRRFLATVQHQNVRFFRRLHWQTLEETLVRGRPHHLMEAELAFYSSSDEASPLKVNDRPVTRRAS